MTDAYVLYTTQTTFVIMEEQYDNEVQFCTHLRWVIVIILFIQLYNCIKALVRNFLILLNVRYIQAVAK